MRRIAAVATLAVIAGVAGCSAGTGQSEGANATPASAATAERTEGNIYGRLSVEADFGQNSVKDNTAEGGPCISPAGFEDIQEGTGVTIKNADGKIVGTTTLSSRGLRPAEGSDKIVDAHCEFDFLIDHIQRDSDFYTVEIGSRGAMTYNADEAFGNIKMSLGDVK